MTFVYYRWIYHTILIEGFAIQADNSNVLCKFYYYSNFVCMTLLPSILVIVHPSIVYYSLQKISKHVCTVPQTISLSIRNCLFHLLYIIRYSYINQSHMFNASAH